MNKYLIVGILLLLPTLQMSLNGANKKNNKKQQKVVKCTDENECKKLGKNYYCNIAGYCLPSENGIEEKI